MSETTMQVHIPALTLGWRLKMALGNMSARDMADALEVHRVTVARWMADRGAPPRTVFVRQWALITQTDPTWLLTGQTSPSSSPGTSEPTPAKVIDVLSCVPNAA